MKSIIFLMGIGLSLTAQADSKFKQIADAINASKTVGICQLNATLKRTKGAESLKLDIHNTETGKTFNVELTTDKPQYSDGEESWSQYAGGGTTDCGKVGGFYSSLGYKLTVTTDQQGVFYTTSLAINFCTVPEVYKLDISSTYCNVFDDNCGDKSRNNTVSCIKKN